MREREALHHEIAEARTACADLRAALAGACRMLRLAAAEPTARTEMILAAEEGERCLARHPPDPDPGPDRA